MPETQQKPNKPELKIGPFPGGIAVNVWLNQTQDGRYFRSVTIDPRSYRDEGGNWKEGAYRLIDLTGLILALQRAQHFATATPLPGEPAYDPETPF